MELVGDTSHDLESRPGNVLCKVVVDSEENKVPPIAEMKGKHVLVDFWTTCCGGCMKSIPELRSRIRQSADGDFTIFRVSLDEQLGHPKPFLQNDKMNR